MKFRLGYFSKIHREISRCIKIWNRYFTLQSTYILVIFYSVLLRRRNVSGNSCRKNRNTRFMFSNFFFENRAVCEIKWKNTLEPDRPQMTIWRMRIACWITKAANAHSEYVIIIAFPLQQWLQESTSMLRTLNVLLILTLDDGSGHSHAPADLLRANSLSYPCIR